MGDNAIVNRIINMVLGAVFLHLWYYLGMEVAGGIGPSYYLVTIVMVGLFPSSGEGANVLEALINSIKGAIQPVIGLLVIWLLSYLVGMLMEGGVDVEALMGAAITVVCAGLTSAVLTGYARKAAG